MTVFARGRWSVVLATALAIGAMLVYRGGTVLDRTTRHYSITHNFLSDLGMTVAWNGERNRTGGLMFLAALVLLVIGLGSVVVALSRILLSSPRSRTPARLAALLSLVVCLSFLGVAATPENRAMSLHITFTFLAFRVFPFAAILLGVATARSPHFARRAVVEWTVLSAALLGFLSVLTWGPSASTPNGLAVQVVAQKAITVIAVGTLFLLTFEGDRAQRSPLS